MAFNTIDPTLIEVSKPTRKEIFQLTKDNFDDHESRIAAAEATGAKVEVLNCMVANLAQYANGNTLEQVFAWKAPANTNIITAEVTVIRAGLSGVMEFDVRKGAAIDTTVSMMSTLPSVDFSAGDNALSVNAVFADNSILEGQFLVIDVTQIQAGMGRVHIRVIGEPA